MTNLLPDHLSALLENLLASQDGPQVSSISVARFRKLVAKTPHQVLDHLFAVATGSRERVKEEKAIELLASLAKTLWKTLTDYLERLDLDVIRCSEPPSLSNLSCAALHEARAICREALRLASTQQEIPTAVRHQIEQSLFRSTCFDGFLIDKRALALPFDGREVAVNLIKYLRVSASIAEFPEFLPLHLQADEISLLGPDLNDDGPLPAASPKLERILTPIRKQQILDHLAAFAQNYPIADVAKQAYAVYLTLGEGGPWSSHPFVRQLVILSYQEYRVKQLNKPE